MTHQLVIAKNSHIQRKGEKPAGIQTARCDDRVNMEIMLHIFWAFPQRGIQMQFDPPTDILFEALRAEQKEDYFWCHTETETYF